MNHILASSFELKQLKPILSCRWVLFALMCMSTLLSAVTVISWIQAEAKCLTSEYSYFGRLVQVQDMRMVPLRLRNYEAPVPRFTILNRTASSLLIVR